MAKYAELRTIDKSNQSGLMNIITRPWFVLSIVVSCFAILTPKIFVPLFRQLFGYAPSNINNNNNNNNNFDRIPPPNMRASREFSRPGPHHYSSAPPSGQSHQTGGSSKSMLNFLLPVYALGIALYMFYTLYKVFNGKKEDEKSPCLTLNDSDFEESMKSARKLKFREKNAYNSFVWDAKNNEFKMKHSANKAHFARSEESEDEMNDYARYKSLDPDYVDYIKQKRRGEKRAQQYKKKKEEKEKNEEKEEDGNERVEHEIPVTPNIGLTSITNTNLLMNETLERMKFSLNKINMQLLDAEKKGGALDDPDLDGLKLQLAQTELQMSKIVNIVNAFSDTIQISEQQVKEKQKLLMNYADSEADGESDDHEYAVEDLRAKELAESDEQNDDQILAGEEEEVQIRYRGKEQQVPSKKTAQKHKQVVVEAEEPSFSSSSEHKSGKNRCNNATKMKVDDATNEREEIEEEEEEANVARKSKKKKNGKKKKSK